MLDKKSILDALNIAGTETILTAHQNLGKNNLVENLKKAIEEGKFDHKEDTKTIETLKQANKAVAEALFCAKEIKESLEEIKNEEVTLPV